MDVTGFSVNIPEASGAAEKRESPDIARTLDAGGTESWD